MPKIITLVNATILKTEIFQQNGYFQVQVTYNLVDDVGDKWSIKEMTKFSAASGLPAEQLLPTTWETVFQDLINDLNIKMTTLEGLD